MPTPGEVLQFPTELWCAGLRLESRRPLDDDERRLVAAHARRLRRLLAQLLVLAVAVAAWPFALAAAPGGGAYFRSVSPVAGIALAGWVLLLPALLLLARDVRRSWARRAADLRADEALVFAGRVADEPRRTGEQRRLILLGVLTPWTHEDQRVVVLAGSRSVHVQDARGRDVFVPAWVHEVAPGPGYAMRVPVPSGFGGVDGHPELQFDRRALAEGEVAELNAYVRRLRRVEVAHVLGVLLLVYALARAIGWTRVPVAPRGALGEGLSVGCAAFVGGWVVHRLARRRRFSDRLARDVSTGWALSLRTGSPAAGDDAHTAGGIAVGTGASPPEVADAAGAMSAARVEPADRGIAWTRPGAAATTAEDAGGEPDTPPTEFLPHSGAVWMDRGRPARWRDLDRAA